MSLNLLEAIAHCEEVANEKQKQADSNVQFEQDGIKHIYDAEEYDKCLECAEEHRQLAKWLKELQWYRNYAGVLFHEGKTYVNGAPIIKTVDKNGMCSFYGFREVGENNDSNDTLQSK